MKMTRVGRGLAALGLLLLALTATAALASGSYGLDWWTVDGGGGGGATASVGGDYALSGTAGQPDAGPVGTGGDYALAGGYWAAAVTNKAPTNVSVDPAEGYSEPGTLLLMETAYADPNGWDDLANVYFRLNTSPLLTNCVYLRYDVQANLLWMRRPDNGAWKGGVAPETSGTVRNTRGELDFGLTTVEQAGEVLTVTWAFTPTYRNSGQLHNLYLMSHDLDLAADGWDDLGDWIINRGPTNIPPDLNNTTVPSAERLTFNARHKDLDGRTTLTTMYYAIADSPPAGEMAPGGIFLKYDQAADLMYLADSAGTSWGTGVTPGTDTTLSNDAVTVIVKWSSIGSGGAKIAIVYWRLEFDPNFAGFHRVYMRTIDQLPEADGDTGWKYKGTLTIAP